MPDRIHSSDVQLFVDDQRIPSVTSLSISSPKSVVDIQRLGASHSVDRILTSNQSTTLTYDVNLTTGATGIDPIYSYQNMKSGFLSTGFFEFKAKDSVGVTTISGAALTSYSINGSVGDIVKGSSSYEGDGAIFTNAGALTSESNDIFDGFFRPEDIEIYTSSNGDEGIDNTGLNIQDFSISVSLQKTPVTRLGTRVPQYRYPQMPAQGSLNFNVLKTDVTGINISSLVCESGVITIDLKGRDNESILDFTTSGCCLESVEESTSLDDNTSVSFSYYFPIIK
jgi:hypothetical protein